VALCPVCRLPVLLSGRLVLLKAAPAPTSDTYCSGPRGVGAWAGDEASGTAGNIYEIEMPLIQSRPPTTRGPEQYVSLIGAGAAGAAFSNTRWVTAPLHQQRISGPTSKTANAGSVGNQAQSACQMPHSACMPRPIRLPTATADYTTGPVCYLRRYTGRSHIPNCLHAQRIELSRPACSPSMYL